MVHNKNDANVKMILLSSQFTMLGHNFIHSIFQLAIAKTSKNNIEVVKQM